ncbi:hypothetical protein QAD02_018857 [Eretmocerus hayati]|uniref:Uncharacterized protein n=1 Tax=Eretmocerus hayati TaxID=131215 RepID=A0ACC2PHJ5_9HYME|nr:hypothetical protein QAD02_018857 [Eretmocerus hayati]
MFNFFGKKKNRESPPSSPEEGTPPSDDNFVFIEKRGQTGPDSENKTPSLYPSLTNIDAYPSVPIPAVRQISQDSHTSDLSTIQFKLCRELQRSMNDDLVIDKLRLDEIVSFMRRINQRDYEYEFTVERSVIAEMNSQN